MFSLDEAASRLGLDIDDIIDFLKEFLSYSDEDLSTIKRGLETGDSAAVAQRAHSIKGAALNLSLDEVAAVAVRLEKAAKNSDMQDARDAASELERKIRDLKEFLASRQ
jgi:HPt (histidine-containing phosphotransfer) domain-containing protein